MFDFSGDREHPFLMESDAVTMVLSGFDRPVKFLFPLEIPGQPPLRSFAYPLE
jgi:hypothetical protein